MNSAAKDDLPLMCCAKCMYSVLERPPGQLMSIRLCKALPPVPIMAQTEAGVGAIALWPPVKDRMHCFQFAPIEAAAPASPLIES